MKSYIAIAPRSALQFAASLEAEILAGRSVGELRGHVAEERVKLALGALDVATTLTRTRSATDRDMLARSAVSRTYYAMFQAARAVVFIDHFGDDKNEHSQLPRHLPSDFAVREVWANELRAARDLRNEADYDPYARVGEWRDEARAIHPLGEQFVHECMCWLTEKGFR